MFKSGDYIFRLVDDLRYVYRVLSVTDDKYEVQVPYFTCWGSTFARWGKSKMLTKKYLEKHCTVLSDDIAQRYKDIKRGQNTSVLFVD